MSDFVWILILRTQKFLEGNSMKVWGVQPPWNSYPIPAHTCPPDIYAITI